LQRLDKRGILDTLTLKQLVDFTNSLYDKWPIGKPDWSVRLYLESDSDRMNALELLSTNTPLAERIMYIALDSWFMQDHFDIQLQQARNFIERRIETYFFFLGGL
jgi:hypothetical protein